MKTIVWNLSFEVGISLLDEQHKQIASIINKFLSYPTVTVESKVVSDLLSELTSYTKEHFQTEESLLEEHGYPDLENHKEQHKALRVKIVTLCNNAMKHKKSVPEDLQKFLHDWWVNHILESDMKYKPFFLERNVK